MFVGKKEENFHVMILLFTIVKHKSLMFRAATEYFV